MIELSANLSSRNFLQFAARAVLVLSLAGFAAIELSGCARDAKLSAQASSGGENSTAPSSISMVSPTEPGEPLIVSGTIYAPDGRTPLAGIGLWVYQTDATGRYSTSGGDNRNTRLHGFMQTNREGRYEFRTIKPASYPSSRIPAHIHAYVSGPGYPEYWIDEYHFADDPFVTDDLRSRDAGKANLSSILTLTRGPDGVWRGLRDIVIERCSKNCTGR